MRSGSRRNGAYPRDARHQKDFYGRSWSESLAQLARGDLEMIDEQAYRDTLSWHAESEANERLRRLECYRVILGEVEFSAAIANVNAPCGLAALRKRDEVRNCPNYDGELHNHELCCEAIGEGVGNVPTIMALWSDLTREQARDVLESSPFVGMTIDQARLAFRGKFHQLKRLETPLGPRELWAGLTHWHAGDNLLIVIFLKGRVEEVVDLDCSDSTFRLRTKPAVADRATAGGKL
jgi:hypothetical protein